jgi:hypothetical protein
MIHACARGRRSMRPAHRAGNERRRQDRPAACVTFRRASSSVRTLGVPLLNRDHSGCARPPTRQEGALLRVARFRSWRMVLPATRRESDEAREQDRKKNGVHLNNIPDVAGPAIGPSSIASKKGRFEGPPIRSPCPSLRTIRRATREHDLHLSGSSDVAVRSLADARLATAPEDRSRPC